MSDTELRTESCHCNALNFADYFDSFVHASLKCSAIASQTLVSKVLFLLVKFINIGQLRGQ